MILVLLLFIIIGGWVALRYISKKHPNSAIGKKVNTW